VGSFDFIALVPGLNIATGTCETHGEYRTAARELDTPKCPHCLQSRIEREAREAHDLERTAHLLKISNIPARYLESKLSGFLCPTPAHQAAVDATIAWIRKVKTGPQNFVITGGVGTGKTHLVCAALRNLIHSGLSCRYETAASLLADIKRAYNDDDKTEAGQIASYTERYNVLVIDEADVSRATDNDMGLLFAVVNGRYNAMRTIVIISNQGAAHMPKWLGERAADRVMEGAQVVACDWESYRRS
jgi:DNA replication protein DnaC